MVGGDKIKMVYYEIYRKKRSSASYTNFKYFKTVESTFERDEEKKNLTKLGYLVRTEKTISLKPPCQKYIKG